MNPFYNKWISAIAGLSFHTVFLYFSLSSWNIVKMLVARDFLNDWFKQRTNRKKRRIWKYYGLAIVIRMLVIGVLCFLMTISSVCSMALSAESVHRGEFQTDCQTATHDFISEALQQIKEQLSFQYEENTVWDGKALHTYLNESLSGDLKNTYHRSAAARASTYIQYSRPYTLLEPAKALTEMDIAAVFYDHSNDRIAVLNKVKDNINSEYFDEYLALYEEYCLLTKEYAQMISYDGEKLPSDASSFTIDHFVALENTIEKIQRKMVSPDELELIRYYHGISAQYGEKLDGSSGTLIARMDSKYLVYRKNSPGLKNGERKIVYACEDTILQLYESLGELKTRLRQLSLISFVQSDAMTFEEMQELLDVDFSVWAEAEDVHRNYSLLDAVWHQLADHINYRYSDDEQQTEEQLQALRQGVLLYQLRDELCQLSLRCASENDSVDEIRMQLNELSVLFQKTGLTEYVEDIHLIQRYFFATDTLDLLYFSQFCPAFQWRMINLSKNFDPLRTQLLGEGALFCLFQLTIVLLGCYLNIKTYKTLKK